MVEIIKGLEELTANMEFAELSKGLVALSDEASGGAIDAVPLEQLKGDIARAGHPVMRTIALDVDNRRLFFVDKAGNFLFAEYGTHDEGYRISRVGMQAEISKEYDTVDLEPEPFSSVTTEHEEEEQGDEPGMIPSGTPGDQPDDEDGRGFGERVDKILGDITSLLRKAGSPPPGLVPQSGDPEHPGRWVKPKDGAADGGKTDGKGGADKPTSQSMRQRDNDMGRRYTGGVPRDPGQFTDGELKFLQSAAKKEADRVRKNTPSGMTASGKEVMEHITQQRIADYRVQQMDGVVDRHA